MTGRNTTNITSAGLEQEKRDVHREAIMEQLQTQQKANDCGHVPVQTAPKPSIWYLENDRKAERSKGNGTACKAIMF